MVRKKFASHFLRGFMAVSALIALAVGTIGSTILGSIGKSEQRKIENQNKRIQHALKNTMWNLNESALKASYHRDMRANMLSEGITMGRIATGLSKANIGVAGTQVPLFEAAMRKTDFDNQGYEMKRAIQMKTLQLNRAASKKAIDSLEEWGSFTDIAGEVLGAVKDFGQAANSLPQGGGGKLGFDIGGSESANNT